MAGSSPREREVGSLWCSAYPRLVGVTSPVSCPHPFVNPFTRHSNLSSFLPSFLISNPFHRCSSLRISFIDIFALPTHASRCIYIYTPATGDRDEKFSPFHLRIDLVTREEQLQFHQFLEDQKKLFTILLIRLIVKKKRLVRNRLQEVNKGKVDLIRTVKAEYYNVFFKEKMKEHGMTRMWISSMHFVITYGNFDTVMM